MKKIDKNKIKTWFVTGASSGVGHKLCEELLNRGYNVIAVARRIPDFKSENALCLSVDVTNPETIQNAIKLGIERFGKIDVLSNNAGISASVTCEEETLEHMKEVMEVNFFGTFNTVNALLPHFRKNKNGTIINNSSMHGLSLRANGGAYCSSKHAIEGFTKVCWHETKNFCRVMTLELGFFPGTDIGTGKVVKTHIEEYSNIKDFYKHFYYTFNNDLDTAIPLLINQVEQEKLPRRLILGKDAYIKVKAEHNWLKKDLRNSKKRALKCAKFNKEFPKRVLRKIINYIKGKLNF